MINKFRPYEVWHDECKKNGYCHGVLFVPLDKKAQLVKLLRDIRNQYGYNNDQDIKYSRCLRKGTKIGRYISNNLALFSHIIQTKPVGGTQLFNRTGRDVHARNFRPYLEILGSFDCKFGFLRIASIEQRLNYCQNYRNKVETTFRFIVKGCCHRMFDEKHPIKLAKLYFDGNKHYKGDLDTDRLLKGSWRPYCEIDNHLLIDARGIKERDAETKLLMSFVDYIVGAWTSLLNGEEDPHGVLYPLSDIHIRLCKGKIFRNANSRWYKSTSFSELSVIDEGLVFAELFRNNCQMDLLEYSLRINR